MKKHGFTSYLIVWAILFVIFNLFVFLIPGSDSGDKYEGTFWIGYAAVVISFLFEIACAWYAFKADSLQKMFYRIPLVRLSYGITIGMTFVGSVFMIINSFPKWLAGLVCAAAFLFNVIAVVKAGSSAAIVTDIDNRVKSQTVFIRSYTVDAEGLLARAGSDEIRRDCKNVYEAFRYSDPMSSPALAGIESQITVKFSALQKAVFENDQAAVHAVSDEIKILLDDRNKRCRLLK